MSSPPLRIITAQQLAAIVARGIAASTRSASDLYAMGGVIYDVWTCAHRINGQLIRVWQAAGFASYLDMVDVRFGIGAKTAMKLKSLWEVMEVQLGPYWNRNLMLPSWKKMYIVSRNAQRATVTAMLRDAANKTVRELEAEARDDKAREDGSASEKYNFHAVLSDPAKIRTLKDALARFHEETGIASHGEFVYSLSNRFQSLPRRRS